MAQSSSTQPTTGSHLGQAASIHTAANSPPPSPRPTARPAYRDRVVPSRSNPSTNTQVVPRNRPDTLHLAQIPSTACSKGKGPSQNNSASFVANTRANGSGSSPKTPATPEPPGTRCQFCSRTFICSSARSARCPLCTEHYL
ncbi:hypothetical protein BGZ95_004347 [Linnemannia exigua]|uniref:Uncharacterized protein n=1 Tax=Linnemannia exigua TaxID=604196 RepID=A0AAD4DHE2_9FUNG|nr:hypothetical protein BGZ95_004347 [Linnemannia exigua]